ncbi:aquaporin-2-like [Drosophila innubila]|uniref:aquaporin-2-like n=1 Tax=Drosophila innubila TaxID=198719 RepID=UPI00148E00D1|nr:aquaporin-2-like [Drosophila innubila]
MGKFNKEFFVKLLAEFLASLFVQFVGCSVASWYTVSLAYSFGWGGSVIAATQAFRIVSGAHINPCISVAAMIMKNVEVVDGFLYILMQLLGSACGFGISYGFVRFENSTNFCVTQVIIKPWWKSIFLELYTTGAWVLAMCASWNKANETMLETISLRIGIVVTACNLAGGAYTGASMNPFRSLWPAIAASYWGYIYIYIAVPLVTSILLSVAWRFLYLQGKDENAEAAGGE